MGFIGAASRSRNGFRDEGRLEESEPQTDGELSMMRAGGSDVRQPTNNQCQKATLARRAGVTPKSITQKPTRDSGINRLRTVRRKTTTRSSLRRNSVAPLHLAARYATMFGPKRELLQ